MSLDRTEGGLIQSWRGVHLNCPLSIRPAAPATYCQCSALLAPKFPPQINLGLKMNHTPWILDPSTSLFHSSIKIHFLRPASQSIMSDVTSVHYNLVSRGFPFHLQRKLTTGKKSILPPHTMTCPDTHM